MVPVSETVVMVDSLDVAKVRRLLNGFSKPELDDLLRGDLSGLHVDEDLKQRLGATRRPTRADAANAAADAIQALHDPAQRLLALATVHCSFLQCRVNKLMPWTMLSVDAGASIENNLLLDSGTFVQSVARYLAENGAYKAQFHWVLQDGAIYACFLVRDLLDHPRLYTHHAAYLVYCPGLPLVATCVTRPTMHRPLKAALDLALCMYEAKSMSVPRTTLWCAFQYSLRRTGIVQTHIGENGASFLRKSAFTKDGSLKNGAAEPGVIDLDSWETEDRELEAAVIFDGCTKRQMRFLEVIEEGGDPGSLRVVSGSVVDSLRRLYVLGHLETVGPMFQSSLDQGYETVLTKGVVR